MAGGVALNLLLEAARVSRDIDIFHDAEEAVHFSFATDRRLLEGAGYTVSPLRELPGFVAAVVGKSGDAVRMEWARDSAFRFFPLMEHGQLGLTMYPFDLATNKVLAMAGRLEVRDRVDAINADRRLQPLGYLLWAAAAKPRGALATRGAVTLGCVDGFSTPRPRSCPYANSGAPIIPGAQRA